MCYKGLIAKIPWKTMSTAGTVSSCTAFLAISYCTYSRMLIIQLAQSTYSLTQLTFRSVPDYFEENHVRNNVPRDALFFAGVPYSIDFLLLNAFLNAFGHPIRTPENLMPFAWRNSDASSRSDKLQNSSEM